LAVSGKTTICVENGTSPSIAVASGSDSASVRLTDDSGIQSATVSLGATTPAQWPATLPLTDGSVYRINAPSGPDGVLEVHMLPTGTLQNLSSVGALETLAARGCERQVAAALEGKPATRP